MFLAVFFFEPFAHSVELKLPYNLSWSDNEAAVTEKLKSNGFSEPRKMKSQKSLGDGYSYKGGSLWGQGVETLEAEFAKGTLIGIAINMRGGLKKVLRGHAEKLYGPSAVFKNKGMNGRRWAGSKSTMILLNMGKDKTVVAFVAKKKEQQTDKKVKLIPKCTGGGTTTKCFTATETLKVFVPWLMRYCNERDKSPRMLTDFNKDCLPKLGLKQKKALLSHMSVTSNVNDWWGGFGHVRTSDYWKLTQITDAHAVFSYIRRDTSRNYKIAVKKAGLKNLKKAVPLRQVTQCVTYLGVRTWKNDRGFDVLVEEYSAAPCGP
jgi:hypothetical protein